MGCGTSKIKKGDTREGMPHKNEQFSTQKAAEMADDSSTTVPDEEVPNSSLNSQYNEYLCGTDITLQWLHKKLMEALGADEPIPHWIAERIDTLPYNKFQRSKVIKVTFGWENPRMPSSVILKVPQRIQDDEGGSADDAQNRLISSMFKRECTVYEWFAKQKKLAVPRTLHIKKHSTESSCGVIVMEDLGEKGQRGSMRDGLAVDGAKDLLRNLAMIHAKSLLSGDWTTMVPDISPLHYRDLAEKNEEASATFLKNFNDKQREALSSYLCADYLASIVTEIGEYGADRVLVHGQPMATNLILQGREKVIAILDWTKAHPGCFAEDVATAICWNLEPKERHCSEQRLLEFYHYNLVKYAAGSCQVTLEQVKKAYAHFLPLAMSVLILLAVNIDMSNDTKDAILERSEMLANDILVVKRHTY